jgi:polyhydroxybutyrate depolymerase
MNRLNRIVCLMALFLTCIHIQPVQAERLNNLGWQENSLDQDKLTRYFRYYVPKDLPDRAPVVILFHGGTQSMRKIFHRNAGGTQQWEHLAEREKFLLLVPNGVNPETGDTQGDRQNWNDCRQPVAGTITATNVDDVGFTRSLITWATNNYHIDRQRVYATGSSNGGQMAYRLATELSDGIAAVAVFVANLPADSECKPAQHPVPIAIINGTQDPIMPWAGGNIPGSGGKVRSARSTLDYWLQVNKAKIQAAKTRRLPDLDPTDNSYIIETVYPAQPAGAEVMFDQIEGGGHTMPSIQHQVPRFFQRRLFGSQNHDLEGANTAWEFLRRQHLIDR